MNDVNQRLKRERITRILVPNTFNFRLIFPTRAIEKKKKKKIEKESDLLACIVYFSVTLLQARKPNAHLFAWGAKNAIR